MKVLLADDHQILRDGIRRGLESAGETVVAEAANGEEAVELVAQHSPDLVLMDLSMPVMDGVQATKLIKESSPQVKVVVLSMHDDPSQTRAALEAGAVGYLSKGTSFFDVLDTLRRVHEGEEVL
ncbi:MAG: response regulator transcription factor, partial [Microthrixaceae bacterium]|nr:response regulator transcription factor [Microthrixaceae bacterium]